MNHRHFYLCNFNLIFMVAVVLVVSYSSLTYASKKHHKAHQHGLVTLKIALDKKQSETKWKIDFDLEGPSESFYGFEHEAKTNAEKKAQKDALDILKTKWNDLVTLDDKLECTTKNEKIEVDHENDDDHHHGEHRDVEGEWSAVCEKDPRGSKMIFKLGNHFPRIRQLRVEFLSDDATPPARLPKGLGEVILSKTP